MGHQQPVRVPHTSRVCSASTARICARARAHVVGGFDKKVGSTTSSDAAINEETHEVLNEVLRLALSTLESELGYLDAPRARRSSRRGLSGRA